LTDFTERLIAVSVPISIGAFCWFIAKFLAEKTVEIYKFRTKNKMILKSVYGIGFIFGRLFGLILIGFGIWVFFTVKEVIW